MTRVSTTETFTNSPVTRVVLLVLVVFAVSMSSPMNCSWICLQ